jgi:RNA polymerase sigma-70 factor, ECF subfamily
VEGPAATLAAREVSAHPARVAPLEVPFEVRGQSLASLVARRDPGSPKQPHVRLDAPGVRPDSPSAARTMTAMDPRADAELVALAREGDLDAFAELVRRHEQRVRTMLLRLLDDERDVEEAAQDAFVQAWRSLERFRGDAAVFTWLYRIAVNEALARLRRKQLRVTPLDATEERRLAAPEGDSPAGAAEANELHAFLAAKIRELPLEYRVPLVLRDLAGLSNEEVAQALELSLPAAKSRIHRARMRIRAELERWER